MMFVSLEQASAHLRRDTTDDDEDLILKIEAASAAIAEYLRSGGSPYELELDSNGDPVLDSNGNEVPAADGNGDPIVRRQVMQATLLLVGDFYANREPSETDAFFASTVGYGYLPRAVVALLYPLRMPIAL